MKLQAKIILTVIIITITVNFLFQYNFIRIQKRDSLLELSSKIEKTNNLLSKINSGPMFYYDTSLIETNILSFLKDPEIKSIRVIESSGEIDLFYENKDISSDEVIEVGTDVYYGGDKIGRIVTIYSKDIINSKIANFIKTILFSLVAGTLLLSIILLIIIRQIIRPIIELTDLSFEISNGNLDKEIHIHSRDEIGTLSRSFMKMRDSIKEKIQSLYIENEERKRAEIALTYKTDELANANRELKAHRIHLEELVQQRTSELQESLDRLGKTKDQLVQSEKMASLGDLVAGVAHEINTPIGIGVTAASHLENETARFSKKYKSGEMSKSMFESYVDLASESSRMILSNLLRAANLIKSFKKVAVDQSSEEKRSFNLKEYIDEILLSIHSKFKHTNVNISVESLEEVIMDSYPGALSQIVTNLVMNSLQHGFENMEKGSITINILKNGEYSEIIYSDTGIGIDKEIQKRIFDPFFTTKRGQGGSGLGMNIVYNLVTQTLKGSIICESELGQGTTFKIRLPLIIE
ncbi:HAMP domain-containing protein [Thiospirochaeta perfilievii]|uniref:histidine kinase n=1 Tax=Thiospirochaeta perfilievii TaxID=252967 RepID=A0A5C1QCW2_9SPIO|nr:ATP-binding protein [Thiospirochaeta perfilievii]QEN05401.1 HAMP domain-containing protein [Thiospirochaeta perfilievii]